MNRHQVGCVGAFSEHMMNMSVAVACATADRHSIGVFVAAAQQVGASCRKVGSSGDLVVGSLLRVTIVAYSEECRLESVFQVAKQLKKEGL